MKKLLSLLVVLMLSLTMFTGCFGLLEDDYEDDMDMEEEYDDSMDEEPMEEDEYEMEEEDMTEDEGTAEADGDYVDLGVAEDGVPFGSFSTLSVYGHEVTDDVFGEYEMTMVNVWATWCPPCIGEMEELEEVYQTLPMNVNVLTICDDGGTETDLAIQILEENGCKFDAIITNDEIYNNFLSGITAFPTTVFVDSEGNIFGTKIEGAPSDPVAYYMGVAEEMMEYLS